ncbi:MAG: helix-turn-helix domain-containing protein [Acidimicrobiales bacterium]|jgi:predicted ArsR family transcriptional regulator|nr:helix-turn-helix domain-containing protein [Acidimicrobiales bacterium]
MSTLQQQARALGDPTRHEIYRRVADAGHPLGIGELTEHLGLNHNGIRQHVAKLVGAGLLVERTAASSGRGRPKLVYTVDPTAECRWGVTGPYERLATLLAEMLRSGDDAVEVGRRFGRSQVRGHEGSDAVTVLADHMARQGFDPEVRRRGTRVEIVLQNCPFESTALVDPQTVCSLHEGIAEGIVEGIDGLEVDELVRKDPRRAQCRLRCRVTASADEA